MQPQKKVIMIGILIGFMTWGGNLFYYHVNTLVHPIFMKQYTEVTFVDDTEVILVNYLTQDATSTIHAVAFPELSETYIAVDDELLGSNGRDMRRQMRLDVDRFFIDTNHLEDWWIHQSKKSEGLKITKMTAYFTNGTVMDVDLGEIYLLPLPTCALEANNLEEAKVLFYEAPYFMQSKMSKSSSDDTGQVLLQAQRDFQLEAPTSYVMGKLLEMFNVSINEQSIDSFTYPIVFKEGDYITFSYERKSDWVELPMEKVVSYLNFGMKDAKGNKQSMAMRINYLEYGIPMKERDYIEKIKESSEN